MAVGLRWELAHKNKTAAIASATKVATTERGFLGFFKISTNMFSRFSLRDFQYREYSRGLSTM